MATANTYTPLSDLPFVPVERCSQVLANKTQCWRPGEVLVSEGKAPEPPKEPKPGDPTPKPEPPLNPDKPSPAGENKSYQLCQMHATIQQRAAKAGEGALEKMLGIETKARTNNMPYSKEEKNYVPTDSEKDFEDMMAPEDSEEYKAFQKKLKEQESKASTAPAQKAPTTQTQTGQGQPQSGQEKK